jgi:hypothetical protein
MKTRTQALTDLLEYNQPLHGIDTALKEFSWDSEKTHAILTRTHVIDVLQRYLNQELYEHQVEAWANAIEGREDIEWEEGYGEALQESIHRLANPLLTLPLTPRAAQGMLNVLA